MNEDVSIPKLFNFIAKVGGRENLEKIYWDLVEGKTIRSVAKKWGISESQFNEYVNNAFRFVPVFKQRVEMELEHMENVKELEQPKDERITEANRVLRLVKSGDRQL